MHGVKNAAVDGFQPVAGIRQGAGHDHAHGIIEICGAHLLVDITIGWFHFHFVLPELKIILLEI